MEDRLPERPLEWMYYILTFPERWARLFETDLPERLTAWDRHFIHFITGGKGRVMKSRFKLVLAVARSGFATNIEEVREKLDGASA